MVAAFRPKQLLRLVRNKHFHEWSQAAQPDGYPDEMVWTTELSPENTRMLAAAASSAIIAILTSFCSIFFPTYSGVRPTIRPAMNTPRMAKSRNQRAAPRNTFRTASG